MLVNWLTLIGTTTCEFVTPFVAPTAKVRIAPLAVPALKPSRMAKHRKTARSFSRSSNLRLGVFIGFEVFSSFHFQSIETLWGLGRGIRKGLERTVTGYRSQWDPLLFRQRLGVLQNVGFAAYGWHHDAEG